jgi:hypothetical protein
VTTHFDWLPRRMNSRSDNESHVRPEGGSEVLFVLGAGSPGASLFPTAAELTDRVVACLGGDEQLLPLFLAIKAEVAPQSGGGAGSAT